MPGNKKTHADSPNAQLSIGPVGVFPGAAGIQKIPEQTQLAPHSLLSAPARPAPGAPAPALGWHP